jgi:hypothetical protein
MNGSRIPILNTKMRLGLALATVGAIAFLGYAAAARRDELQALRAQFRDQAARDLPGFVSSMPAHPEAEGVAQWAIQELRWEAADADPCVPRMATRAKTAAGSYARLQADLTGCAKVHAGIEADIAACGLGERCGEMVRAWYCLHEGYCEGESEEALEATMDARRY